MFPFKQTVKIIHFEDEIESLIPLNVMHILSPVLQHLFILYVHMVPSTYIVILIPGSFAFIEEKTKVNMKKLLNYHLTVYKSIPYHAQLSSAKVKSQYCYQLKASPHAWETPPARSLTQKIGC